MTTIYISGWPFLIRTRLRPPAATTRSAATSPAERAGGGPDS